VTTDETYMDPTQFKYVVPYFNNKEIKKLEKEHIGFTENYKNLGIPKRNTWKKNRKNRQINKPVEETKEKQINRKKINKVANSSLDKISQIDKPEIDEDGNPSKILINQSNNSDNGLDEPVNSENMMTISASNSFDL
jgi:hypothetical protein